MPGVARSGHADCGAGCDVGQDREPKSRLRHVPTPARQRSCGKQCPQHRSSDPAVRRQALEFEGDVHSLLGEALMTEKTKRFSQTEPRTPAG